MNQQDDSGDFDVVVMNPAAFYATPNDVMADTELSHAQKLRLLEEWEIDLRRKLESDSEGMTQPAEPDGEGRSANDAALLREVSNWLRKANAQDRADAPKTVIGRVWHRLFSKDGPRRAA